MKPQYDYLIQCIERSTVAYTVMEIWLEKLGDFGAKTGRFTRENMAKFGPLKIRIILCSNLCQMIVFDEKIDGLGPLSRLLSFFAVF